MQNKVGHIIGTISRTVLGLTFLFSGIVKAIDPLGTTYKIEDYLKAFGGVFTNLLPAAEPAAFVLITIEVVLGLCLLMHIKTKWTSWLTLAFMAVMTPLTLYLALTNPVSDCGCFGDAVVLTNWQTFWKNIVLLVLVIVLLCTKRFLEPIWVGAFEAVVAVTGATATVLFMVWTLYHLPVKDFRPYKIGNHIPTLMEFPDDAETDQYEIKFVYEKDGQKQTFSLADYPKNDSSWTFVDQQSVLVKKGYEPPIHDFELMSLDYEDLTYDILESEEPVTLAVMYDLQKADRKQMTKLEAIRAKCEQNGRMFYILTGSGEQEIEDFGFFPREVFLNCDPVTLKTIVRANPGIIVVQNGTIIEKYNVRNL